MTLVARPPHSGGCSAGERPGLLSRRKQARTPLSRCPRHCSLRPDCGTSATPWKFVSGIRDGDPRRSRRCHGRRPEEEPNLVPRNQGHDSLASLLGTPPCRMDEIDVRLAEDRSQLRVTRMAERCRAALGSNRPLVGLLGENRCNPEWSWMLLPRFTFDVRDDGANPFDPLLFPQLLPTWEGAHLQLLRLHEPRIESIGALRDPHPSAAAPVEPVRRPNCVAEQLFQRGEARPLRAPLDEALLHPMREDVPEPLVQCVGVEHWSRRVPPLPQPALPRNHRRDLPGDVSEQKLHEARKISLRGPDQQMDVVRSEDEGEQLDRVQPRGPGQNPADEGIGTRRWPQQKPCLKAARGDEVATVGFEVAEATTHRFDGEGTHRATRRSLAPPPRRRRSLTPAAAARGC